METDFIKDKAESEDFSFPSLFSGEANDLQTGSDLIHTPSPSTVVALLIKKTFYTSGRRRDRGGLELLGNVARKLACAIVSIGQKVEHKKGRKARDTLSEEDVSRASHP